MKPDSTYPSFLRLFLAFAIMILLAPRLLAQDAGRIHVLEASFGGNHIDNNLRVDFGIVQGRHSFLVGAKWGLKIYPKDDQNFSFRMRAYPQNFVEHLGLQFGYRLRLLHSQRGVGLFAFYDVQASRTSMIAKSYIPIGSIYDPATGWTNNYLVLMNQVLPARLCIEQNIGIGVNIPMSEQLAITQLLGLGLGAFREDFAYNGVRRYFYYDPIFPFYRVGLRWKF